MTMKTRYTVIDGEIIAEKRSGVRKQYVPDPLGSTVALLDNTQAQTDTFAYWPYGEEASHTGTTPASFRYVGTLGYYRDSSTKTYVRARELDVQKGRWLTQDPIGFDGGDVNQYRYIGNRPTCSTDEFGTQSAINHSDICSPSNPPLKFCGNGQDICVPSIASGKNGPIVGIGAIARLCKCKNGKDQTIKNNTGYACATDPTNPNSCCQYITTDVYCKGMRVNPWYVIYNFAGNYPGPCQSNGKCKGFLNTPSLP